MSWLLGQSVSMLFVGAIAGGLLAVLLGFMQGPDTALYALALTLVIQQNEGNVLMPLVERWAVGLPPVLGIAATVMFGVLFGVPRWRLAAPAMIVLMVMVLVQRLYIKEGLEEGG